MVEGVFPQPVRRKLRDRTGRRAVSSDRQGRDGITVNGEERPVPREGAISTLLVDMGIRPDQEGIAIAVNGELVLRRDWISLRLTAGDAVELVRAVQGGQGER